MDWVQSTHWQATAYNPQNSSLIIPLHQLCVEMVGRKVEMVEGYGGYGGESRVYPIPGKNGMLGRLTSWDLRNMQELWSHEQRGMFLTSVLTTAGGLAFIGDLDRYFKAFDVNTEEELWRVRLGSALHGFPITYAVDGQQYIAVPTGMGVMKLLPGDPVFGDIPLFRDRIIEFLLDDGDSPARLQLQTGYNVVNAQARDPVGPLQSLNPDLAGGRIPGIDLPLFRCDPGLDTCCHDDKASEEQDS